MTVEEEVVRPQDAPGARARTRLEIEDLVEEPHRRAMRQQVQEVHRVQYTDALSVND